MFSTKVYLLFNDSRRCFVTNPNSIVHRLSWWAMGSDLFVLWRLTTPYITEKLNGGKD